MHEHKNWPSWAHPGAHRHAEARARLAVSWAGLAVSWPRPPAVSQPKPQCHRAHARAPAPCPARRTLRPCAPFPVPLRVVPCVSQVSMAILQGVMAVSWPSAARASTVSQRASACPCAMLQDTSLLARPPMSRYKTRPCNTIPY